METKNNRDMGKDIIRTFKFIIVPLGVVLGIMLGCSNSNQQPVRSKRIADSVVILTIDGCEYIFWEKGYGSDMEHHANCKNHGDKENQEE